MAAKIQRPTTPIIPITPISIDKTLDRVEEASGLVLGYTLNAQHVANRNGSLPVDFVNTTIKAETIAMPSVKEDKYTQCLDFGTGGYGLVDMAKATATDPNAWHLRLVFCLDQNPSDNMVLVEYNAIPLMVSVIKGSFGYAVKASVKTTRGVRETSIFGETLVVPGVWNVAHIVYDGSTLTTIVQDKFATACSVNTFGELEKLPAGPKPQMSIGRSMLCLPYHGNPRQWARYFKGKMAAITFCTGRILSNEVEKALQTARLGPLWYITDKVESMRATHDMGEPIGSLTYEASVESWFQDYQYGTMSYHPPDPCAFGFYGCIRDRYRALPDKRQIGYLVSDECPTFNNSGRKSMFSQAGIYWSGATGAWEVLGSMYVDYEAYESTVYASKGQKSGSGLPTQAPQPVSGGIIQEMERAAWFLREGSNKAMKISKAIYDRWKATGGVNAWGFPIATEGELYGACTTYKNPTVGSQSGGFIPLNIPRTVVSAVFDKTVFYSAPHAGVHEVHGTIYDKWMETKGVNGEFGLPMSDIVDTQGRKYCMFEGGVIVTFGETETYLVPPFRLFLVNVNSRESEGFGQGQNDIYVNVWVSIDGKLIHQQRVPSSGDWEGQNVHDAESNISDVINPGSQSTPQKISFAVEVVDADSGGGGDDDHLGVWTKELNVDNAWGLRESYGQLHSGGFEMVNDIYVSIKRETDKSKLTREDWWWSGDGQYNRGTDEMSKAEYAEAFVDVDSEPEWYDIMDWVRKAFYELVVKGVGRNGVCFGMSVEANYVKEDRSAFGPPLPWYKNWEVIRPRFDVKQEFQVGTDVIYWFLEQWASGYTHDPRHVFYATRNAFGARNWPVLCLSSSYTFLGANHTVLPVGWHEDGDNSYIEIFDPSDGKQVNHVQVRLNANTFSYKDIYNGGAWSGSRLFYVPWDRVSSYPHTPCWELILMILRGAIIICGSSTESATLSGGSTNLYAHGPAGDMAIKNRNTDGLYVNVPFEIEDARQKPTVLITRGVKTGDSAPDRVVHAIKPRTPGGNLEYFATRGQTQFGFFTSGVPAEGMSLVQAYGTRSQPVRSFAVNMPSKGATSWRAEITELRGPAHIFDGTKFRREFVHATVEVNVDAGKMASMSIGVNPGMTQLDFHAYMQPTGAARTTVTLKAIVGGKMMARKFTLDAMTKDAPRQRMIISPSKIDQLGGVKVVGLTEAGNMAGHPEDVVHAGDPVVWPTPEKYVPEARIN